MPWAVRIVVLCVLSVENSHSNDELPGGVALGEVADGVGRFHEGVGALDDRLDGAGLDELGEGLEVLGALLGDQAVQPLSDEP